MSSSYRHNGAFVGESSRDYLRHIIFACRSHQQRDFTVQSAHFRS
jgi:hypothetical protein